MKHPLPSLLTSAFFASALFVAAIPVAHAQDLVVTDGSTKTIDLDTAPTVSITTSLNSDTALSGDTSALSALDSLFANTQGWVVNLSGGVAVIAVNAADPSVNFYGAFLNTTSGSASPFSITTPSDFAPVTYNSSDPATTTVSFHAGLTDSGLEGTGSGSPGVSANIDLQGYLTNTTTSASVNLAFNDQSSTDSLNGLSSNQIYNDPGTVLTNQTYGGPYNELDADVTGSSTYGAIVTFNGVIDVDALSSAPEPSTLSLLLGAVGLATLGLRLRRLLA